MKKDRIKYLMIVNILLMLIAGCSKDIVSSEITTVAYPIEADVLGNESISTIDFNEENVQSYLNDSGDTVLRIYSAPLEKSRNSIIQDGDNYVGNGSYIYKNLMKKWTQDNPFKIFNSEGVSLEITPLNDVDTSKKENTIDMFGQKREAIIYENAFGNGINLICSFTSFGINMEIEFLRPPEKNTYQFCFKLPKLIPDTNSSDYILFKTRLEQGEVKAIFESPLAIESNGNWNYNNSMRLIESDEDKGVYVIEYGIDEKLLFDKETKYPVKVNQSVNLYKSKQPDTSVYEKSDNESGYYLSPYILLGDSTVRGEGYAYIRYEVLEQLDIPVEKIISVNYVFRNLFDLPKKKKIGVYAVIDNWCSINTRWNIRSDHDVRVVSQTDVKLKGDYRLDITPLFIEILKNKGIEEAKYSVRNSFMIKADTKDSNIILASGDGGLFSPYLEIVMEND